MNTEIDRINQLKYARKEGKEEGMKEGMEKGREEGRKEGFRLMAEELRKVGMKEDAIRRIVENAKL